MKFFRLAILSLVTLAAVNASAYDWKKVELNSADGTKITLNFTVLEYSYYGNPIAYTQSFWIHVNKDGLSANDRVRVVLITYPFYAPSPGYSEVVQMDLNYVGGNEFRLDASQAFGYRNVFNARQELAIVVNGQWLKDSWNPENSNFQFRLLPYRSRN